MKITASQLRRIISEAVTKALTETPKAKSNRHWMVTTGEGDMGGSFMLGTVEAPNEEAAVAAAKKKFGKRYEIGYSQVTRTTADAARSFAAHQAREASSDRTAAQSTSVVKKTVDADSLGNLWLASFYSGAGMTSFLGVVAAPDAASADAAAAKKWGTEYTGNGGVVEPTTKTRIASLIRTGRL